MKSKNALWIIPVVCMMGVFLWIIPPWIVSAGEHPAETPMVVSSCVACVTKPLLWMQTTALHLFQWMYQILIFNPLRLIYMRGPAVKGYGFWNGQDAADVCAQLTKVPSSHWISHPVQCEQYIDNQIVTLSVVLWMLWIAVIFCCALLLLTQLIGFRWFQYHQASVVREHTVDFLQYLSAIEHIKDKHQKL
jgi:hypothetical protein